MSHGLAIALCTCACLSGCANHTHAQRDERPVNAGPKPNLVVDAKARAVLDRVLSAYLSCKTYSDEGTVVSPGFQEGKFSTRFKRPYSLCFRFDASEPKDVKGVYWTSGPRTKVYKRGVDGPGYWLDTIPATSWDTRSGTREGEFTGTLASYGGFSSGAGSMIPQLLVPVDTLQLTFKRMPDLVQEPDAVYLHRKCLVLYSQKYDTRIWIDKEKLLILRVVEQIPGLSTTEFLLSPKFNIPIAAKELAFTVPKKESKQSRTIKQ